MNSKTSQLCISLILGLGLTLSLLGLMSNLFSRLPVANAAMPPAAEPLSAPAGYQRLTVTLPISSHPVALTIQPQTGYVYVLSPGTHEIAVISGTSLITAIKSPTSSVCLPGGPFFANCLTDIQAQSVSGYVLPPNGLLMLCW